jgi:hypothetical protein
MRVNANIRVHIKAPRVYKIGDPSAVIFDGYAVDHRVLAIALPFTVVYFVIRRIVCDIEVKYTDYLAVILANVAVIRVNVCENAFFVRVFVAPLMEIAARSHKGAGRVVYGSRCGNVGDRSFSY